MGRRIDIEADDIGKLLGEGRVVRVHLPDVQLAMSPAWSGIVGLTLECVDLPEILSI